MLEQEGFRILNTDYYLSSISDIELADTMQTQCEVYAMAYNEMSTAILEVWASVVRIAKEIVKRERK